METVTDRITRYLLGRIRRRAILDIYAQGAATGLLSKAHIVPGNEDSGTVWRVSDETRIALAAQPTDVRQYIAQRLGAATTADPTVDFWDQNPIDSSAQSMESSSPVTLANGGIPVSDPGDRQTSRALLSMLRERVATPNVAHVAVALLVARAAGSKYSELSALLSALQNPSA